MHNINIFVVTRTLAWLSATSSAEKPNSRNKKVPLWGTRTRYLCLFDAISEIFFWASSIHWLAALDLGPGFEQPFGSLIVQNRQGVQATTRPVDWTLEDNMVDGLFFCTTLIDRRGGHTPFAHYPFHCWSAQRAARMSLLSEKLMSCFAARTNGRLDLKRRAFALGGQVSAEQSRCPGSMGLGWRSDIGSRTLCPSMAHSSSDGFFLRMEVSLRVACFVYCGKARTITTHESQQTKHSEALAYEHDKQRHTARSCTKRIGNFWATAGGSRIDPRVEC